MADTWLSKEEELQACWGQFDGTDDGYLGVKAKRILRDGASVDPDVLLIINTGRVCTMEEMQRWAGAPCPSYTPGCATCEAWGDWHAAFRMLQRQHEFREQNIRWEAED